MPVAAGTVGAVKYATMPSVGAVNAASLAASVVKVITACCCSVFICAAVRICPDVNV